MKILVISDSHGKNDDVKSVIHQVGPIDMLIHLGDIERGVEYIQGLVNCPVYMVAGNNDYDLTLPAHQIIDIGPYKAFITHGHRYYVNHGVQQLRDVAIENGVDIAMYGHTHIPYLEIGEKVTILNPGSLSYPRQDGRTHTFLMIEIETDGTPHYTHGELKSSLKEVYRGFYK